MNITKWALALGFVLVCAGNLSAEGVKGITEPASDDSDTSLFVRASVQSKYVFRGVNLYDGLSFQPNLGLYHDTGFGRLGGGIWMHVPLEDGERDAIDGRDRQSAFNPYVKFVELDFTLSYDVMMMDSVFLSVGHTWYTDPEEGIQFQRFENRRDPQAPPMIIPVRVSRGDTSEFYASLAIDCILNPEITVVADYREFEYQYYTLGLSESFDIPGEESVSVKPFAKFAFSTGNDPAPPPGFMPEEGDREPPEAAGFYRDNGLVHIDIGVSGRVQLNNFSINPSLTYTFAIDDFQGEDDIIWAGVAFDFDTPV